MTVIVGRVVFHIFVVGLSGGILAACSNGTSARPCPRVLQGFANALHSRTIEIEAATSVIFTADCNHPCRIEVYLADNPAQGILCANNSAREESAEGFVAMCMTDVRAAQARLGVDVGTPGQDLRYALKVEGEGIRTQEFALFEVPAGFN